jgi:uncharacterized protein YlxW (UPF0749 family)
MSEARRSGSSNLTTQLLVDLVTNTLDPGYAAAARRRGPAPAPARRRLDGAAVVIGCLLIGFTLVVAYVHTHRGAPEAAKVHDRLVAKVRDAQRADEKLAKRAQQLNGELTALRDEALSGSGGLSGQIDREQAAAGQVAVRGPGLEVMLKEPPQPTGSPSEGRGGSTPITATHILTDRDLRSVVNELWSDGAEAISVNDVRLTPTSSIRFAGEVVLIDRVAITSPYTVRAIGDADGLATGFAISAVASRYHTLVSASGIGFSFTERASLSLPASGAVTPSYAHARPTPSGSR